MEGTVFASIDEMLNSSILGEWTKCLLIIVIGIFLQQFLSRFIFSRFKKSLQDKGSSKIKDIFIGAIEMPTSFLIIVTALYLGLHSSPLHLFTSEQFGHVYRSAIIVSFFAVLYNLCDNSEGHLSNLANKFNVDLDAVLINLTSSVLRVLIITLAFISLAGEWKYDINGVIAGLGIGGLALAMASKDSLSNIFGGFVILTDKPFTMGDWISASGVEGSIEDITFRSTRIRTIDQGVVHVPNANLASVPITNYSRRKKRRAEMVIGLTYCTTKAQMQDCMKKIKDMLDSHEELTHEENDVIVVFSEYAASSLNIFVVYNTVATNVYTYMQIKSHINLRIMDIIAETGTSMAFPTQSLYIEKPILFKQAP